MPWQQHVLDVGLEIENGRFAYQHVVVHVQRRAGKTVKVFMMQTHRAVTRRAAGIWYGAQSRKDGLEIWDQQLNDLLVSHKDRLGFKHRRSVGSERLDFTNGSRVALFTPADSSLVGLATDLVTVDEARFHSMPRGLSLEAGIRPTQATRDGQLWIPSSSGTFGLSDWLWSWMDKGKATLEHDGPSRIAYFDYSIPDDADPADLDVIFAHHPAAGYTLTREFLEAEQESMDPNDFAREYAGRWTSSVAEVIASHDWRAGIIPDGEPTQPHPGELALTFSTSPDRGLSAICVGWRDGEGRPHVSVADQRPGADWVHGRFLELVERWKPSVASFNAVGPALSIADEMTRAGVKLLPCGFTDYVVACGTFLETTKARTLRHNDQPDLTDAVKAVAIRKLGDRWVWGHRASAGPIVALEGATVALWAFDHQPPPKPKSRLITLP
jgi:hypothetical protein